MTARKHTATATVTPLKDARAGATRTGAGPVTKGRENIGAMHRSATRGIYEGHLTNATSSAGDLYSRRTIEGYLETVDAFGDYLTRTGFTGDYVDVTVDEVNGWLAAYRRSHTQGGTNTKARRLRTFFGWVEATYDDHVNPFRSGKVARYKASEPPPSALGGDVVHDLLATCRGKAYEDVRDTAIIRMLMTGARRAEVCNMWVEDLDLAGRGVRLGAFKSARAKAGVVRLVDGEEHRAGRYIPINDDTVLALQRWLRVRAGHKLVDRPDSGWMWYGTRGRSRMTGSGILRMVKRRAAEAGYDPDTIGCHAFRHTRADELLRADVAEGDVMEVLGWRDREMVDRYARNLKNDRAVNAIRARGLA